MKKTFGQFNPDKAPGLLRPISFPQMTLMDYTTGDGRELASTGAGVRDLPRTIFAQFAQADGHDGSVPVATLQEVTFHDDGNVTGRGWLADLPLVRDELVPMIVAKVLHHNSVDLAEVTYEIVWKSDDPADGMDYFTIEKILFTSWKIAATTIVGVPAFADARVVLDEVTAALVQSDSELEWGLDMSKLQLTIENQEEVMASMVVATIDEDVKFDDFHMPEPDAPTGHTVTEDGRVFGHIAEWGKCHVGVDGTCVLAPRPMSYNTFNQYNVLTDKGMVKTGPIFFLGGHPDAPLDPSEKHKAYGGIENAWADVHVVDGRFGPWYSGRVRPGLNANSIYAARASGISGHWKAGDLQCIVSCNVRGYPIPGTEIRADRGGASFDDKGEVLDLVASLRIPNPDPDKMRQAAAADVQRRMNSTGMTMVTTGDSVVKFDGFQDRAATLGSVTQTAATAVVAADYDDIRILELELALDELDDEDDD